MTMAVMMKRLLIGYPQIVRSMRRRTLLGMFLHVPNRRPQPIGDLVNLVREWRIRVLGSQ